MEGRGRRGGGVSSGVCVCGEGAGGGVGGGSAMLWLFRLACPHRLLSRPRLLSPGKSCIVHKLAKGDDTLNSRFFTKLNR